MLRDNETIDPAESEFDSLLKRAAYVSSVQRLGAAAAFVPGQTLLGGRLRVVQRIGEGGMGVVYEAYDERRQSAVALKTLGRLDADGIYRLKQEFRSVAEVTHPGLCHLYELFTDAEWFFTMELVRGQRFDTWVRPRGALDERRLRSALPRLCDAVAAVHRAGKLHRDLKPSNVLVTHEGRVVVLDFGLATDLATGGIGQTLPDENVSGTPAYMSPEQAAGAQASPASDLYAIGAMLFEALSGRLPFGGRVGEILAAKQRDAAPPVRSVDPAAPEDLAVLCDALLSREPALRPASAQLREKVGAPGDSLWPGPDEQRREAIVGRDRELAELHAAYEATLSERGILTFVSGKSGMGKSALVAHFLDDLRRQGRAAVLAGRCYERENVPFKAFDSVVDDISRYLRKLSREEAGALMPREVFALGRLFPALERVAAAREAPKKEIPDAQELQQRAFAALHELLGRIRDRRPLVVHVDDFQWTDRDSTLLMESLFAQPEPVPLLLIVSHRSEGAEDNALLRQVASAARKNARLDCRELAVGPLPAEAARRLAERMLGDGATRDEAQGDAARAAAAISEEAEGSPFFVGELVRHARVAGGLLLDPAHRLSLQQAVTSHIESIAPEARALLDVLAVAGRPLPVRLALDAAGATHDSVEGLLSEHLLRVGSAGGAARTLECYHDKIRECVSAALGPAQLLAVHRQLADHLSRQEVADPEHLALHYLGAGEPALAVTHFERAGDASAAALAFDHAARQYEQALALASPGDARPLRVKLASALASSGSSYAAASMYRAACDGAPASEALDHMCAASHLLMSSGYLDEGRVLLADVLAAIGVSMPRSRERAIASALLSRARLWLRGLRLSEANRPTHETEARLKALWTAAQGSIGNDPFLMVEMVGRYTRLALDSGARAHAARALAMEAYLASFDGAPTRARSEGLLAEAAGMADATGEPELRGWVLEMRGCVLVHEGRFADARPVLREAVAWLETRCKNVPFELACGRGYDLNAANHLGDFREIAETAGTIVHNSLRRGDLYQATGVASFAVQAWLAHRGLDYTQSVFGEAKHRFKPQTNFQWADYLMLMGELHLALYEGQPQRGVSLAAARWPALAGSQLLRMQIANAMMQYCRGGCVLAAMGPTAPAQALGVVGASVAALKKMHLPYTSGWAAVLEAGLAQRVHESQRAGARLREAIACFDGNGMRMYAAAARRRLGKIGASEDAARSLAAGDAAMAGEGVADLDATTAMLTPGGPQ